MDIYASARKHGVSDLDILHAIEHALAAGDQDDGKVLHLGPDRAATSSRSSPWFATTSPKS